MATELTLEEYKIKDAEFFKRLFEYMDKKAEINKKEHEFIEHIEGKHFNEKSDKYFKDECYKPMADMYERMRELLKKKYNGYTSKYDADFYTELTEEALDYLSLDKVNAPKILEEAKQHKGQKCYLYSDHKDVYIFEKAIVTPDDYYFVLVDKDGKEKWLSCVGEPEWILDERE